MILPSDFKIGDPNPKGHFYPKHWTKDDINKHLKIHNRIRNQRFYENNVIHYKLKDKRIHIKQGEFVITFN
jgi:hypothetical protein